MMSWIWNTLDFMLKYKKFFFVRNTAMKSKLLKEKVQ